MRKAALNRCLNIEDMRALAKGRAHKMVFDYIDGGADDEIALRQNSDAFLKYDLKHKVLVGVDDIDTSTNILGQKIDVPFVLSPAAGNRLFHTEGEWAVARGAATVGTVYALSTLSSVSIEDIAKASNGPKWFQLYVWKDRALVKEMLDRARAAGYTAMILTVDFPITGYRERDFRNGFTIPPKTGPRQAWEAFKRPAWTWDYVTKAPIRYANLDADTPAVSLNEFVAEQLHAGFTWKDAEWLLNEWGGKSLLKGVVRADDAVRAMEIGFDAIVVSNHGGRQLGTSIAPLDALPSIVDSVSGRAEIILDGGVRRGTDVLKAIALGANAVSFARPYLYGLAAAGEAGVDRALTLIQEGIRRDMALMGVRSITEVDSSFLHRRPFVS